MGYGLSLPHRVLLWTEHWFREWLWRDSESCKLYRVLGWSGYPSLLNNVSISSLTAVWAGAGIWIRLANDLGSSWTGVPAVRKVITGSTDNTGVSPSTEINFRTALSDSRIFSALSSSPCHTADPDFALGSPASAPASTGFDPWLLLPAWLPTVTRRPALRKVCS